MYVVDNVWKYLDNFLFLDEGCLFVRAFVRSLECQACACSRMCWSVKLALDPEYDPCLILILTRIGGGCPLLN